MRRSQQCVFRAGRPNQVLDSGVLPARASCGVASAVCCRCTSRPLPHKHTALAFCVCVCVCVCVYLHHAHTLSLSSLSESSAGFGTCRDKAPWTTQESRKTTRLNQCLCGIQQAESLKPQALSHTTSYCCHAWKARPFPSLNQSNSEQLFNSMNATCIMVV
ncbi:hypothetical protein PO909_013525 [Leuciscus waleckii]